MGKITVGLLGGSFNPPHSGHLHISIEAKKKLGCQQIWWLIAKQNPFKNNTISFNYRFQLVNRYININFIKIATIENNLRKSYSYDVIDLLKKKFPQIHFVWIMGSDNLTDFHYWHRWRELCQNIPIMVFERKPNLYSELKSRFAYYMKSRYLPHPKLLINHKMGWNLIRNKCNSESSTKLRNLQFQFID